MLYKLTLSAATGLYYQYSKGIHNPYCKCTHTHVKLYPSTDRYSTAERSISFSTFTIQKTFKIYQENLQLKSIPRLWLYTQKYWNHKDYKFHSTATQTLRHIYIYIYISLHIYQINSLFWGKKKQHQLVVWRNSQHYKQKHQD